ncbi:MAG: hypothetical protein ACKO45_02835 [Cyanobium sp.]
MLSWLDAYPTLDTTAADLRAGMALCVVHQLSSWDALVLNVAAW